MARWLRRQPRRYYGEPQRSYRGCAIAATLLLVVALALFGATQARNAGLDIVFFKTKLAGLVTQQPMISVSPTPPAAVRTPVSVTVATPTRAQPGSCPLDCNALRACLVELVNRDRAGQGLATLQWHEAPPWLPRRMRKTCCATSTFRTLRSMVQMLGSGCMWPGAGPARAWGENFWTYTSGRLNGQPVVVNDFRPLVEQAEISWMNSPGHRANLLNDAFSHIGVGIVYSATAGEMRMVQVFLTPMRYEVVWR